MKTKLQSMGFTKGHAQLIGIAVVIFAVLVYSQSNISLHAMFSKADNNQDVITYEKAKAEVLAKNGATDSTEYDQHVEDQFAMLTLKDENGQVLGDAVGLTDIPSSEELFTPETLAQITVKTTVQTDKKAIEVYAGQVVYVESRYDVISLLSQINSDDKATVALAKEQAATIVRALNLITVPQPLVEYHRYKLMYYTSLINIGEIWLGERDANQLQVQTKILMSVMNKLESMKSQITQKYSVEL